MKRKGLITFCAFSVSACSEYGFAQSKIKNDRPSKAEEGVVEDTFLEDESDTIDDIISNEREDTGYEEDKPAEETNDIVDEDFEDTGTVICGESPEDDCDFDGWSVLAGDCNDNDPLTYPFAGDTWDDGLDNDCDNFDCEAGWSGSVYYALCGHDMTGAEVINSWEGSEVFCQEAGYDGLARIQSEEENEFVMSLVSAADYPNDIWIGLSDEEDDGVWEWTDGTLASWTNFGPGEPSPTEENCVELYGTNDWTWNDRPCNEEFPATCQAR